MTLNTINNADVVGIRTCVDVIWWSKVCTICANRLILLLFLNVKWTHGSIVAHGYGPRHSSRQPNAVGLVGCFCLSS